MKTSIRVALAVIFACVSAASADTDLRDSLIPDSIRSVRVNLNPWGPHLGFEIEIAGDDPRLESLVAVIRGGESGGGHKCANAGAIRFWMADGRMVGVGLLPSHEAGLYELRLYDGDEYVAACRVNRAALLEALGNLGLPMEDPAFRE